MHDVETLKPGSMEQQQSGMAEHNNTMLSSKMSMFI
jgi:hypothetical protein